MSKKNLLFVITQNKIHNKWLYYNYRHKVLYINTDESNFWTIIKNIFNNNLKIIKKYDNIFFMKSDVNFNMDSLIYFYELFNKYDLNLAAPSIKNCNLDFFAPKGSVIRFVNFLHDKFLGFNKKSLFKLLEEMNLSNLEFGWEWAFPKIIDYEKIGLIDAVSIESDYVYSALSVEKIIETINNYNVYNFNYIEYSRIEFEEEKICCFELPFIRKIEEISLKRPSRRSGGCCEHPVFLSNRMMLSTGGPWMS